MPRYVLSPRAQNDIEEIWNYTVKKWGIGQAELYTRQLQTAIEAVARHPHEGRSCSDIRAGYYKYPAGSHIVFYRMVSGCIDVVRILHKRMDVDHHL